jgi:NO-binding membrane sensor protein with MHYT domain
VTADDIQTVAVVGGWSWLFAALAVLGLTVGALAALHRLARAVRTRRNRRRAARQAAADLATCCAIAALPTVNEPTKD